MLDIKKESKDNNALMISKNMLVFQKTLTILNLENQLGEV